MQLADLDQRTQQAYENKLSDWMAIEAIIRQKDREVTAANIAKLTAAGKVSAAHGGGGGSSTLVRQSTDGSMVSNDVFESNEDINTFSSRTASADKISTITEVLLHTTSPSRPTCCFTEQFLFEFR